MKRLFFWGWIRIQRIGVKNAKMNPKRPKEEVLQALIWLFAKRIMSPFQKCWRTGWTIGVNSQPTNVQAAWRESSAQTHSKPTHFHRGKGTLFPQRPGEFGLVDYTPFPCDLFSTFQQPEMFAWRCWNKSPVKGGCFAVWLRYMSRLIAFWSRCS